MPSRARVRARKPARGAGRFFFPTLASIGLYRGGKSIAGVDRRWSSQETVAGLCGVCRVDPVDRALERRSVAERRSGSGRGGSVGVRCGRFDAGALFGSCASAREWSVRLSNAQVLANATRPIGGRPLQVSVSSRLAHRRRRLPLGARRLCPSVRSRTACESESGRDPVPPQLLRLRWCPSQREASPGLGSPHYAPAAQGTTASPASTFERLELVPHVLEDQLGGHGVPRDARCGRNAPPDHARCCRIGAGAWWDGLAMRDLRAGDAPAQDERNFANHEIAACHGLGASRSSLFGAGVELRGHTTHGRLGPSD